MFLALIYSLYFFLSSTHLNFLNIIYHVFSLNAAHLASSCGGVAFGGECWREVQWLV